MRPNAREVRRWFDTALLSDTVLACYVATLRDDPNWRVTDTTRGDLRALTLLYFPDGIPFDVVLRRTNEGWRPRVS